MQLLGPLLDRNTSSDRLDERQSVKVVAVGSETNGEFTGVSLPVLLLNL